jgi:hypothetical protein
MLSRHLYVITEVQAALAYAISRGRTLEAAFWCDELVDTGLEPVAWTTLLETWLWQALVTCPEWASVYYKQGSLVDAAQALCCAAKDNSLWWVLVAGLDSRQPDRLTYRGWTGLVSAEECFRLALLQKKVRLAWWLVAQGLAQGLAKGLAKGLDQGLAKGLDQGLAKCLDQSLHPTMAHCATLLLACCDRPPLKVAPPFSHPDRSKWLPQKGCLRTRRRYPIPVECLYGQAGRGLLPHTTSTLPSLWALEASLRADPGPFWSSSLPSSQDEDACEAFYATYFPDDLPEECLTAAQERFSHGPGLLRPSEESFSWARLSRIWFRSESRFAWGHYEWPETLPSHTEEVARFEQILTLQTRGPPPCTLTPVRPKIEGVLPLRI